MRSCEQKRIDSFSLFRKENALMRFSDLSLFLIHNTKYKFVAVFQNNHRSQKVVDEKELSTTSGLMCLQPKICNLYD